MSRAVTSSVLSLFFFIPAADLSGRLLRPGDVVRDDFISPASSTDR
jgi:hypothetical protein